MIGFASSDVASCDGDDKGRQVKQRHAGGVSSAFASPAAVQAAVPLTARGPARDGASAKAETEAEAEADAEAEAEADVLLDDSSRDRAIHLLGQTITSTAEDVAELFKLNMNLESLIESVQHEVAVLQGHAEQRTGKTRKGSRSACPSATLVSVMLSGATLAAVCIAHWTTGGTGCYGAFAAGTPLPFS